MACRGSGRALARLCSKVSFTNRTCSVPSELVSWDAHKAGDGGTSAAPSRHRYSVSIGLTLKWQKGVASVTSGQETGRSLAQRDFFRDLMTQSLTSSCLAHRTTTDLARIENNLGETLLPRCVINDPTR